MAHAGARYCQRKAGRDRQIGMNTTSGEASGGSEATASAPGRIRLMLSGGGHRAMIGSIGAVLYLVLTNWWYRVDEVVSVSGGSVTNAALIGAASEEPQDQIDTLRGLYDTIRADRARPWSTPGRFGWTVATLMPSFLVVAVCLSAFGIIDFISIPQTAWVGMLLGILGPLVVVQAGRRTFSRYVYNYVKRTAGTDKLQLGALSTRNRQHVICATGRASAQTYYLWAGGSHFSSGGDMATPRAQQAPDPDMLGVAAQSMRVAEAAYASCSLPALGILTLPDTVTHHKAIPGEVLIDPGWTGKFGQQVSDRLEASRAEETHNDDPNAPKIIVIDAGTRTSPQGRMGQFFSRFSIIALLGRWNSLSGDAVYVNDLIDALSASVLVRFSDADSDEISTGAVRPTAPIDPLTNTDTTSYRTAGQIWHRFEQLRADTAKITLFNVTEPRGFDAIVAGFVGTYMALEPNPDGVDLYRLLELAGERFGVGDSLATHWDPHFSHAALPTAG